MANAELNVTLREETGKGAARKLRVQGLIPAVVYGKSIDPCSITVAPKELEQAVSAEAGWNTLITLKGAKPVAGKVVVLRDLKLDPIRRDMLCADFYAIDLKQKGSFMVPVVAVGKSEGEKAGGSLQVIRHELEVLCLPSEVPASIEIDVSALNIGDVVHIDEVVAPAGVEVPYDVNFTVITVVGHKPEVEEDDDEVGDGAGVDGAVVED